MKDFEHNFDDEEDNSDKDGNENEDNSGKDDDENVAQQKGKRKKVTIREFVIYRFMIWNSNRTKSILYPAGRLFQQYIVDQFSDEGANVKEIVKKIILSSSFVGSIRYLQQIFQDSTTNVREFEKIHLFVADTCNSNWPEIVDELLPNQHA
ncbi:9219_t:CDS:2 [Diversispora eburnea]|uniref:9219_t:CDS:1 n=1 Tax=Diversispora eburnea TaxID=1213867 RepID=A0A9N8ZQV5_9GLOM|nr:9219_t:CDS:2 [Diversispora eburnea]